MDNVSSIRSHVSSGLRSELAGDYVIVVTPDHPLLLKGPDLLVGGDGNLTALYTPTSLERSSPSHLRARFILGRLALPGHARHILLLDRRWKAVDAGLTRQFAITLTWNDKTSLSKIAQDRGFLGNQRPLPPEVALSAKRRFADIYVTIRTIRYLSERRKLEKQEISARSFTTKRKATPIDRVYVDDGVRENFFEEGLAGLSFVKKIVTNNTNEDYSLDDSVPYLDKSQPYEMTITDIAASRGDPEKLLRAAAFAGWAIVDNEYRDRSRNIAVHLSAKRNRRRIDE